MSFIRRFTKTSQIAHIVDASELCIMEYHFSLAPHLEHETETILISKKIILKTIVIIKVNALLKLLDLRGTVVSTSFLETATTSTLTRKFKINILIIEEYITKEHVSYEYIVSGLYYEHILNIIYYIISLLLVEDRDRGYNGDL